MLGLSLAFLQPCLSLSTLGKGPLPLRVSKGWDSPFPAPTLSSSPSPHPPPHHPHPVCATSTSQARPSPQDVYFKVHLCEDLRS